MAGPVYVYQRLWNPGRENIYGDTSNVLNYLEKDIRGTRKYTKYIEVFWVGTTQAGEQLGTAADSAKDGTTTPFQISVVSAQANDTDAATGDARKVALIGTSVSSIGAYNQGEQPKMTVEVINLSGTTDVTSVRYYLWVDHAYVCDWGFGGADAKGDITIESPADADLLTIKATYNESQGGLLHFADGDDVQLDFVGFGNTATLAAGDGVILKCPNQGWDNALNVDRDMPDDYYSYIHYGNHPLQYSECWLVPQRATKAASIQLHETLVANAKTMKIHVGVKIYSTKY